MTTRQVDILTCDRCKREVEVRRDPNGEPYPTTDWLRFHGPGMGSDDLKFFSITHTEVVDLCPECCNEFSRWWKLNDQGRR